MVKNKRDLKSPHRRSLIVGRSGVRTRPCSVAGSANIRVIVRVRPPSEREAGSNHRTAVKIVDEHVIIFDPEEDNEPFFYHGMQQRSRDLLKKANRNIQFLFDRVFGFDSTNVDIFNESTKDLINSLMDGYNCSVFVYGATGAGKTHTMLGHSENPGITFLTMSELFKRKKELEGERDFELGITYLEVYNENVQDLLCPGSTLHLREDGKYGVKVQGIQVKRIEQPEQLFELLERGNRNRTQHPTDANAESSRSHAVFQVYLRMKIRATEEIRISKLSMIDLAGSERGAATGCAGARFTEGANINKSLLALGNCINSLADGHRHVPYRDSKLTRLLKDSLGGNCQTVMIANVSPSSLTFEDTYNTLKYAVRAKKIKSQIKKNVLKRESNVGQYVKLMDELSKENEKLKAQLAEAVCSCQMNSDMQAKLEEICKERRQLLERLHQIESSEQLLKLRVQLKEEADARLSGLCSDTPERVHGHKRLGQAVGRLQRQAIALQEETTNLRRRADELESKAKELLQQYPHLQTHAELGNARFEHMKSEHKAENYRKMYELLEVELHSRDQLLVSMSKVLQPCFLQLRGQGYATESLVKDYHSLVRTLQGIRSVTWDDDISDSGVSSSTTVTTTEENVNKRKLDEETLNGTFVLSSEKSHTLNVCAEQLMAKVYKPSPSKRLAKTSSASPRIAKENRLPRRTRPIGTMGTSQRFPMSSSTGTLRQHKYAVRSIPK